MKNVLFLLAFSFMVVGCENAFFEDVPESTPKGLFEQTWKFTNDEYSFFEFKKINWDSIYLEFEPKISDNMNDEALFDTLGEMLYLLKDGHVNLKSDFNRSRNWTWYLDAPDNYNKYVLERNYFKQNEQYVGSFVLYDFGDVGYIHYASFSNSASKDALDYILTKFKDHKGLIIDVRDNFGGSLSNVYNIGQRFISQDTTVAYTRDKVGPVHDEFSDYADLKFTYNENDIHFTKPVVVLTNRKSYSAGNFFPTCMRSLPNVTIMGDLTGGGGGAPSFTELTNGWSLRVSNTQLFTLDGVNTEGGLEPDIKIDITQSDLDAGIDTILEEALKLLRE